MRSKRTLAVVLFAVFAVALLTGAVGPGHGGVAAASHGPEEANYTVVPMSDRSPGADNVRYGQRVVATAGIDLKTLEQTTATYEEGSWSSCGPSDGETFGIDRGNTMSGYQVDESLQSNVKSFSAGEDLFKVDYYGQDDFGSSTYLNQGDEFISVATCIDNPDEPGWYQISGTTSGVSESGERVTFGSESHYFWICNCENQDEAREQLGPPPSEPQSTPTPTATPTPDSGEASSQDDGSTDEDTDASENESPQQATATPTSTAADEATATATPVSTAAEAGSSGDDDTSAAGGVDMPTGEWDDHVLQTPTAAEGPGFGPAVALLGILGAVLLFRRRS